MKRLIFILIFLPILGMGQNLNLTSGEFVFSNVSSNNSFAEMYESEADTIATPTTGYYPFTKFIAGSTNEASVNDSACIINQNGTYLVNGCFSFTHSANLVLCHFSVFKNAEEQLDIETERKVGTGGDYGAASFSGFVEVTDAPDTLYPKAKADDAGNLIVNHFNFSLVRIK